MSESLTPSGVYLHWKSLPRGSPEQVAYAREHKEDLHIVKLATWAQVAKQNDDPDAFSKFYYLVHGVDLPEHAREWVEAVYEARGKDKGIVIEAFRGSTKTTTITITFTAYRIGKTPERANLLIQVGDDIAADNSQQIADIIANNPAWKMVFPHIEPDRERGWGAGGYEVKRTDMSYEEWRKMNASRKDPTLVGVGYKSREIIGKHPDGMLVVDDIHDENNTSSERELERVRKILTGTIFPTITPDTWSIFIGTPWVESDVLNYVASTGEFEHIKTPVYVENEDREIEYTWAEKFGEKAVDAAKKLAGSIQFARMFLLDLSAAHNKIFKYQTYPHSEIRFNWPMGGGVDYAGVIDPKKSTDTDYFAMAYVAKLPGGGAVVVDGVLNKGTQAQGESYVKRAQEMFPIWLSSVVEGDGKGEEFIQVLQRNPGLRIIPMKTRGRGKEERLVRQMGPWLENGMVRISDAETPFLLELRRELDAYPNHAHDDAMDALYWALRGMPDVLQMPRDEEELPRAYHKEKVANPFVAFGRR